MENTYQPIFADQNKDRLHPYVPRGTSTDECRWCDVPRESHVCPHYHLVPKTLKENLAFRIKTLDLARNEPSTRATFRKMCAEDPLFYCNTFGVIFEPRTAAELPFLTYPFQDELLLILRDSTGKYDLVVEKSRDMGASWCVVFDTHHAAKFVNRYTALFLSRKQELVDRSGDPKSLFWKLDFLEEHLPAWLQDKIDGMKMHRENMKSRSSVDGESTNEFAGVADRRMRILLDEFSKMDNQGVIATGTRDVSPNRIFLFTPEGSGNKAHELSENKNFRKISVHWHMHPVKSRGLYRVGAGGKPELLDIEYWTPERAAEYQFITKPPLNPKYPYRSPWYDEECLRALDEREIAKELDIDYGASDYTYYPKDLIDTLIAETAVEPMMVGEMDVVDDEVRGFQENPNGRWKLWVGPDRAGRMPHNRRFVVAADVAMGTGGKFSSESAMVVVDRWNGEKVAEFTDSTIDPKDLADLGIAVCKWFQGVDSEGALFAWEQNGPGHSVTKQVLKRRYGHIYYREKNEKSRRPKASDQPGFRSTPGSDGTKLMAHANYRRALADRKYLNRSDRALRQCREYVFTSERTIEHTSGKDTEDPTQSGENHGDIVVADMIACLCLEEVSEKAADERRAPTSSMFARYKRVRHEAAVASENNRHWNPLLRRGSRSI